MNGPRPIEDLRDVLDEEGFALVHLGHPFVVDHVGLSQQGPALSLDQCDKGLQGLCTIMDAIRYWRGDLMNLTEGLFAEEAAQIIDHERLSEADAKAEMWVAAKVLPSTRAESPSWEHSRAVSKLETPAQRQWLKRARAEGWSARKLATELAQAANDGKTVMRWTLVVDCGTEAKMEKLGDYAEAQGLAVLKRQGVPRKVRKPKKAKKEVTAKRRGPAKMATRRRVPK